MNAKEFTGGIIGTSLSALGTAMQVNELLQTISLVVTIVGALISFVVVPLLNWYRNAKKDGKISADEITDAAEKLQKGISKTQEAIKGSQTANEDQREEIKSKKKGGLD